MRRAELWRIYLLAKTYGVLPSEIAMLSLPEFHFNEAVSALGIRVENILNAHYDEDKGQLRPELSTLLTERGERPPETDAALTLGAQKWFEHLVDHAPAKPPE